LLTPLFVFDQFEEVLTLGATNAPAVARLRTDLADLIENRMPANVAARMHETESAGAGLSLDSQRYKVLLSFREDFVPALERWKRDLPSIMRNRLQILPMSGEQAFEAVHKTAPDLAPESIARRIVSFVAAAGEESDESAADQEVAPALLSLVCRGLNERRKEQGKASFDDALLTGTGQAIVEDFYWNAVAGLPEPVQRFIERELIIERGFRKPYDVDDALTIHGITADDLALMVNRRVLRIEPVRGADRVELTHDLLTRVGFMRRFAGDRGLFSPDGKSLITNMVKAIKLWDIRSGRELQMWQGEADRVTFSGDGKRLAMRTLPYGLIHIWDLALDRITDIQRFDDCFTLNGDGTRMGANGGLGLTIMDTSGLGTPLQTLIPAAAHFSVHSCEFTPDGNSLIANDSSGNAFMWQPHDPAPTQVRRVNVAMASVTIEDLRAKTTVILPAQDAQKLQAVAFSPDASRVVTSGSDARARVWDTATGKRLLTLVGHQQPIFAAAYSPDGNRIATAGIGPVVKLWDAHSGRFLRDFDTKRDRVLSITISPDSKRVVTAGNGNIKIWDIASGVDLTPGELVGFGAAFSADGKRLALADTRASMRDAASLREVLKVSGDLQSVGGIAVSGDGQTLAVAQPDGVHTWRQDTGWKLLRGSVGGERSSQIVVVFTKDGKRLVTPGTDNTLRVWDTQTATQSAALYYAGKDVVKWVAFSRDEKQIYAVGDDWTIYRFATPLADLNAEAVRLVTGAKASLTDEDCGTFLHQQPCPAKIRRTP
jgi:WD40 repeat protein